MNSGKVVITKKMFGEAKSVVIKLPFSEIFGGAKSVATAIGVFGLFCLFCGGMVIVGAALGYRGRTTLGGVFAIVFSALSLPTGGGFLIGILLGIVGGTLILAGK